MKDNDFERVLARLDRTSKRRGGGQISDDTADRYRSAVRDFREWCKADQYDGDAVVSEAKPIEDADFYDIEEWYAHLDEKYQTDSGVSKGKGALRAFYIHANKLADGGRIDIDPWGRETPDKRADYTPETTDNLREQDKQKKINWLTPEQVDELARSTDRVRDELICRTLFQTGLRVSEMCDTRIKEDLDREERSIRVRGKGAKNRTVYYQPSLDLLMDVWIDERRAAVYYAEESPYLFPTSHSEKITRDTVETVVAEAAEKAGLQAQNYETIDGIELNEITPHVLRHSFAQSCKDKWDLYTLSKALGHGSVETTASYYLHDDDDKIREAYRRHGPSTAD